MRGTGGIQQHLNTKTFGKSGSSLPSTLDSIQEAARKAGNWRNASIFWETAINGVVNFKQRWLRGTARKTQLKSAHIVPRWVDQGQGPILTIKLDAVTGTAVRRAAHNDAGGRARLQ